MHDRLSGMLPNVARLTALQKACEQLLPEHFTFSEILQLEKSQLTIGVPNQATAAKLRQKLPLLQTELESAGWPVETIRVKVKLKKRIQVPQTPQKEPLPPTVIEELGKLEMHLAQSGTHPSLMDAIHTMLKRHQQNAG